MSLGLRWCELTLSPPCRPAEWSATRSSTLNLATPSQARPGGGDATTRKAALLLSREIAALEDVAPQAQLFLPRLLLRNAAIATMRSHLRTTGKALSNPAIGARCESGAGTTSCSRPLIERNGLTTGGRTRLESAMSELLRLPPDSPIVIEGYAAGGSTRTAHRAYRARGTRAGLPRQPVRPDADACRRGGPRRLCARQPGRRLLGRPRDRHFCQGRGRRAPMSAERTARGVLRDPQPSPRNDGAGEGGRYPPTTRTPIMGHRRAAVSVG